MRVIGFVLVALLALAGLGEAGEIQGTLTLPKRPKNASVLDAIVYVNPLPDGLEGRWGATNQTFTVIQRSRRFMPRVTAAPVGSTIRFQNRDDVYHNVFSVSPAKRFDLGKYPPNATNQVTFTRPGIVNLFCDIHPGEAAWVFVAPNRLYVRPEYDGTFTLPKLPPGFYTVIAWHPSFGRVSRRVEVPHHGDAQVALKF